MRPWVLALPLLITLGCGTSYGTIPSNHIVMVNTEGHPVDPTGNTSCEQPGTPFCNGDHNPLVEYPSLTIQQYDQYLDTLIKNLVSGQSCTPGLNSYLEEMQKKGALPKILIFLHGGLNTQTGSVERAAELCKRIADEGSYPIFINWQSSLFPSYGNHLLHIRQGEDWRGGPLSKISGYLSAPVYFAGDLTRALVRAPIATFFQIRNDLETVPAVRPMLSLWASDLAIAQESAFTALCQQSQYDQPDISSEAFTQYAEILGKQDFNCKTHGIEPGHELSGLNLSVGPDKRESFEKTWAFAKYFLTLPTKLITAPIIDAGGTSAWDVMLRSVTQLFHYDGEQYIHNNVNHSRHNDPNGEIKNYKSSGALYLFFKRLERAVCGERTKQIPCENSNGWEITLVGHSTGAIIAHHILREFEDLPIKNIVYMGAASTIRDYQETVFPYLARKNKTFPLTQDDTRLVTPWPTHVYHLMLHEAAESGEWLWDTIDPFPRGSLLIWLDNFLSHPGSKEDRTLGRFTNFITMVHHTPPSLRPYIHIQKFGVGETVNEPKKHGDFGQKLKFWDPRCWKQPWPSTDLCYNPEGHY
ncbi:MAG: hypothetical protein HOP32_05870 [Nitrospira sp.]|nr:hypothetical protein [Nitrospira sp.]